MSEKNESNAEQGTDDPVSRMPKPLVIDFRPRDVIVFGLLAFLCVDAVGSWINRPKSTPNEVATVSIKEIFSRSTKYYEGLGQSPQQAQLNTAILYDYVKVEIVRIDETDQFAAIIDAESVYGGRTTDVTDVVFERAIEAASPRLASLAPGARPR